MSNDKKLNEHQLGAVRFGKGPLLIIAGAGTGKTTVITHRIKNLIDSKLAEANQILAITFTEKAAAEMEARLDELLPMGMIQTTVCTFHSLCDQILRDDSFHIGLPSNYTLATPAEVLALVNKHLYDFHLNYFRPLATPERFISYLLSHVDRLRDEDISPQAYSHYASSLPQGNPEEKLEYQKFQELSSFYSEFQQLKIKNKIMDFADLIYYTLQLFRERPNILKIYQEKWPWILVDEYQDTNYAQTQLVSLMAKSTNNITVVADDDQSIYRWRGTSTSNVLKFTTEFPNVEKIVLTENYRSTQNILDSAYTLITHNNPDRLEIQANIPKKLVSKKIDSDNFPVVHFHFSNSESEAEGIGSEIIKLKAQTTNLKYKDFAILVRANAYAESFIQAFERLGIPFQFLGPSRLFDKPEIKQLVSYLKLIVDSYDEASLFNVLSSPWVGLPGEVLSEILSISKHDRRPLILVAKESSDESLKKFFEIYTHHRSRINSLSAGEILYDLLNQLDWLKHLILFESISDESIAANIIQFFNRLKSHQSSRADSSVPSVVNWIDFLVEAGESPQAAELTSTDNDAVNILTIHSSKGLEFEVVFLPCLVSLRFPSINRSEPIPIPLDLIKEVLPQGDAHLQEERRLFYVAMTRAKERLYLSSADYYGDAKRAKKPSIFISEALGPSHSVSLPKSDPIPRIIDVPVDTHPTIHKVDYLDYSRIQTFKSCPLHYKAKYILNLSTPPSASSTFGNIIHKTLKDYYENLIRSNPQDIHKLLDANWEHKGFGDPRRESLFVDKAHDMLQRFVENKSNFSSLPIKLEEPFKFKLSENLIIGGKIDRLDVTPDNKLHIFDYKTTSEKNQLDESEAASDLQLSVYALASTNLKHYPFNRKPQEILLSLYYLDTGERIDTTRTIDQLDAAIGEILDVQKQITESNFHCSKSYICKEGKCDYYDLCKSLVK